MADNIILAISPGTRYLGIGVFHNDNLYEWKVKTYPGKWSNRKHKAILGHIREIIENHLVTHLACKVPHECRHSKGLSKLIEAIKELAIKMDIFLKLYVIDEMKKHFKIKVSNKEEMARHLCSKYPELYSSFYKHILSKNKYHLRMFEAVATGLYCFRQINSK